MTIHAKNFIAGEWVEAGNAAPDLNPSNTGDVVGHFPRASRADAERAVAAAKHVFPSWSRTTLQERHDILKRIGDEIALDQPAVRPGGALLLDDPLREHATDAIFARDRAIDTKYCGSRMLGHCLSSHK